MQLEVWNVALKSPPYSAAKVRDDEKKRVVIQITTQIPAGNYILIKEINKKLRSYKKKKALKA